MSKNYYGNRSSGGSLKHYRTKGSRNGYSKDPNYRPVGDRAKGQFINGRYVYDQGAQNDWQQKGNAMSGAVRAINNYGQSGHINLAGTNTYGTGGMADLRNRAGKQFISLHAKKGAKNNWQQQAARTAAGGNAYNNLYDRKINRVSGMKPEADRTPYKNTANKPYVSKEYQEELAYNSRKNVYPGQSTGSTPNTARSMQRKTQSTNVGSGRKSKEYEAELAYNSKKNVYPGQSTKPGINYANDARFQRSDTQNKVINEAMKQKDAQFRAAGLSSDPKLDAKYRRGVENEVARSVPDKIQEANAIGRYKQAYNKAAHPVDTAVASARNKARQVGKKVSYAASSAAKSAKSAVAKGEQTVNNILNKFKKKKR